MIKIGIDARILVDKPCGIANYLIDFLNIIIETSEEIELILLSHKEINPAIQVKIQNSSRIKTIIKRNTILNKGIIWHIFSLPRIIKKLNLNFFWGPAHVLPIFIPEDLRKIITVHDLVPIHYRRTMPFSAALYTGLLFRYSVKNADILLITSNYTFSELKKLYNNMTSNIIIGESINKSSFKVLNIDENEKIAIKSKYNIHGNFILFVGTLEPRKNLRFLLSLMPSFSKLGFYLLVVGARGWGKNKFYEIMNHDNYPKERVVFSNFISHSDLIKIYNIASMLVIPSINEGFCIPALEAMCCGCPIVAANNSAINEIVADAGELVDGWDEKNWINAIIKVYSNREKYVLAGFNKSKYYAWENIAEKFIHMIDSISSQ